MIELNVNIPFYGKGRLLQNCLKSVFDNLNNNKLEIAIFDDASLDNAVEFLRTEWKSHCSVYRHEKNIGMVANWNSCLQHGDKEYVHVLHYDDALKPIFYAKVLKILKDNQKVGLVHTDAHSVFFRKTSTRYWGTILKKRSKSYGDIYIYKAGDEAVRHTINGLICSSVIIRRDTIADVGIFNENFSYSADEEYWARIGSRWDIAYLSEPLIAYSYHHDNYQVKTWKRSDFWEKYLDTRKVRFSYMKHPNEDDFINFNSSIAHVAVVISHRLLAAGFPDLSREYMKHAVEFNPDIIKDKYYKRLKNLLSLSSIGRLGAWLRSSH